MGRVFGDEITDHVFKLDVVPDESSFTSKRMETEFLRAVLEGGEGHYRRDLVGSSLKVTAQWTLDDIDYEYVSAFYRVFIDSQRPFKLDLPVRSSDFVEVLCSFMPGTYKLTKQVAHSYTVQATLEVRLPEPQ